MEMQYSTLFPMTQTVCETVLKCIRVSFGRQQKKRKKVVWSGFEEILRISGNILHE